MTRPEPSARRAVFTIASANYISFAATLMQSVRDHHPEVARFIVLVDDAQEFPGLDLAAQLLPCRDCGIGELASMAFWYDVIELNTAVKPSVFLHLFGQGFGQVVYLDPDILVASPLTAVWDGLDGHSCVLTPHHMHPLQDGGHPGDLAIMKSGIYNLGFAGLCADADGRRLASWWADRLLAHCRVDIAGNLFTDQRWMDLAPAFVARLLILRHPGYNLAYWNLVHRTVGGNARSGWTVDGQPLAFVHFSGIKPDDPAQFSKHQDRFTAQTLPPAMAKLCALYRARVLANDWARFGARPYSFGHFPGGRRIEPGMRRWVLRAIDQGRIDPRQQLEIGAGFFDQVEDVVPTGVPITRLMYQFWLDRPDLQAHFPIASAEGAAAYIEWFKGGDAEIGGVEPISVAAARQLGRARAATPPWAPIKGDVWTGPSSEVAGFLAGSIEVEIEGERYVVPRGMALAWERRADLQQHLPLTTAAQMDAFVVWCLTHGAREGTTAATVLPQPMLDQLTRPIDVPGAEDVPITNGLMLTRDCPVGREMLAGWRGFPQERTGRFAHGLWYAYIAPALFRWPDALVEPVRRWFTEQSELTVAGFRMNRAAMVLWWLRKDVAAEYPLFDEKSRGEFLIWLLLFGLKELGVPLRSFDPLLADQLTREDADMPGVPWFGKLLIEFARPDLGQTFDVTTDAGRSGYAAWCRDSLMVEYGDTTVGEAMLAGEAAARLRTAVALTGTWTSPTGIGEDLRSTAHALRQCGFDEFVVIDIMSGRMLRPDGTALPEGTTLDVGCNVLHLNADTAPDDWRRLRDLGVRSERTVGVWAWELETLPKEWLSSYGYVDELWAMSRFTGDAVRKPGLRPVRDMRHTVMLPEGFAPAPRDSFGFGAGQTVFLYMFDPHSFVARKNPQGVIRAFMQAFPDGDEPARLVIKTHGAASFPEVFDRLRALATDRRIEFLDERMSRERVLSLVAAADAFVSLHRSEGFGRGPAEAMLLGKPVILTDYSGTRDFADAETAKIVPFTLVPVLPDEYVGVEGQRWAEPALAEAAAHMRWVLEQPEAARALGRRATARITAMYSPAHAGARVLEALGVRVAATSGVRSDRPAEPAGRRANGNATRTGKSAAKPVEKPAAKRGPGRAEGACRTGADAAGADDGAKARRLTLRGG